MSVSIAEQQAAQMLHALEGGEGEQNEGHEAENGGAKNHGAGDGEAAGYD